MKSFFSLKGVTTSKGIFSSSLAPLAPLAVQREIKERRLDGSTTRGESTSLFNLDLPTVNLKEALLLSLSNLHLTC